MIFALVGNQNCGKTTLFNLLTASNQHVGNFPGITVEHKIGNIKKVPNCKLVDLPGIYSIRPYTQEEIITRDFILNEKPDGIINIVDATNIERNLYLTLQLLELEIPMVIALNMMDEIKNNKGSINISELSNELGVPVVPISAIKNDGILELLNTMVTISKNKILPIKTNIYTNKPLHKCILTISQLIENHTTNLKISPTFAAIKIIEGDIYFQKRLALKRNEIKLIDNIIIQMEKEINTDKNQALAQIRYDFIEKICKKTVVTPKESKQHKRSMKIDAILTNKLLALPIFIFIMLLIFELTFNILGNPISDKLSNYINNITVWLDNILTAYKVNHILHSLIINGIFTGIGSVLSFLPIILILFLLLSILEDTGYMARVAFIMDKLLRKIGLSGKSFVPMLLGFGCTVPAVMATRTLTSERDRKITILLTPYMSCSAKIPIYAIICSAFFQTHQALIMTLLYFVGIIVAMLIGIILKKLSLNNTPTSLIMELPNYRMPSIKNTLLLMSDKAKDFIQKAFTLIFISTIIIWFLQSFDTNLNFTQNSSNSLVATLGKSILHIFSPLGFKNWEIITALFAGITAKEAIVGTLAVLLNVKIDNLHNVLTSLFTPLTAFCFLVFILLYPPCLASIATIRNELKSTWQTIYIIIIQLLIAWFITLIIYKLGGLFI